MMTIARFMAKRAVQEQIRARGQKIAQFTCREISAMADAELERNLEELIANAVADCLTFLEFSRYRAEIDVASVRNVRQLRTL
jgi:hypothetical protein